MSHYCHHCCIKSSTQCSVQRQRLRQRDGDRLRMLQRQMWFQPSICCHTNKAWINPFTPNIPLLLGLMESRVNLPRGNAPQVRRWGSWEPQHLHSSSETVGLSHVPSPCSSVSHLYERIRLNYCPETHLGSCLAPHLKGTGSLSMLMCVLWLRPTGENDDCQGFSSCRQLVSVRLLPETVNWELVCSQR